jgi:hypothetical protein
MNRIIKGAIIGAIVGGTLAYCAYSEAQVLPSTTPQYIVPTPYQDSPYNFNNNIQNFENSPYNFNNSPYNFNNSPYNYGAPNRIYDSNGAPMGYTTTTPSGVTNYYDFEGNRFGYQPAQ